MDKTTGNTRTIPKKTSKIDLVSKDVKSMLKIIKRHDVNGKTPDPEPEMVVVEVDDETRSKVIKFIISLINLECMRVSISSNNIAIDGDLEDVSRIHTKGKVKGTNSAAYLSSDYLSVRVVKDKGFEINRRSNINYHFKCESLYDEIKDSVKSKVTEIAKAELVDVMDEVLVSTGLARQNNLNELIS